MRDIKKELRKVWDKKWPQNKLTHRVQGNGYVTPKNKKEVPPKKFVNIFECCKKNFYEKLTVDQQKENLKSFYTLENKEQQDTFFMNCTGKVTMKRRATNPITKNKNYLWNYYLNVNGKREKVCKSFFQKLY